MKKLFLLCFTLCLAISANAKDLSKEYIKIIHDHDVPKAVRHFTDDSHPELFWNLVYENNPTLKNLNKNLEKMKGAEKDAIKTISELREYNYKNDVYIIHELREFCDSLAMDMGLPMNMVEINVIYDSTPNAFTVLTKKGFAICLNLGLLELFDDDYGKIMAVTAHEFTHGIMKHHVRHEYAVEKKKRKDRIIAGIAIGLGAVAQAVDAGISVSNGLEHNPDAYTNLYRAAAEYPEKSSLQFRYKYGRKLELEADLYAYRFMTYLGYENTYKDMLIELASTDGYWENEDEDDESDHPSVTYRINFIDFVQNNPSYQNEVKAK